MTRGRAQRFSRGAVSTPRCWRRRCRARCWRAWAFRPNCSGTSGGGQFLAVLAAEHRPAAHEFLIDVTQRLAVFTGGRLRLAWAVTENLGAWSDVRKRLDETMARWRGTAALDQTGIFEPFVPRTAETSEFYAALWQRLRTPRPCSGTPPREACWPRPTCPCRWPRTLRPTTPTTRPPCRRNSPRGPTAPGLGGAARGRGWAGERLKKAASVEEHIQVSVLLKQLFAGEAQALAAQPEFWRKVTILYTGGDDFAVFGCWDALIAFASGMHRIFSVGVEEILKEFPGPEGKTLSHGPGAGAGAGFVAGGCLRRGRAAARDDQERGPRLDLSVWPHTRLETVHRGRRSATDAGPADRRLWCPPQLLGDLAAFYRETDRVLPARAGGRRAVETQDRPWRFIAAWAACSTCRPAAAIFKRPARAFSKNFSTAARPPSS